MNVIWDNNELVIQFSFSTFRTWSLSWLIWNAGSIFYQESLGSFGSWIQRGCLLMQLWQKNILICLLHGSKGWTYLMLVSSYAEGHDVDFSFYFINQQSEYKVFYKLMGWLWVKLVDVLARWDHLLRGDLSHYITGQLATIVPVFVRCCLVEWGGVVGSSEFLALHGARYFCRRWRLAHLEYLGLCGSEHCWHTMGHQQLLIVFLDWQWYR